MGEEREGEREKEWIVVVVDGIRRMIIPTERDGKKDVRCAPEIIERARKPFSSSIYLSVWIPSESDH